MTSRTGCSCDFLRLTTAAELNNRFNMRLPAASTCIGQSPSLHDSGPRTRRPVARRIVLASAFVAVLSGLAASSRAALIIGFTGSTGDVNADAGFQRAANYLQPRFSDNVSVTINRGFAALSPGVLGSAGSFTQTFTYTQFRTAVAGDITTASDSVFSAGLPGGSSFSMYTNRTAENGNTATPYVDTTGANTTNVRLTTANAKALSLSSYSGTDANITFSNLFTWDFDNSDGVTAGAQDFVGVAIHELMHALGFTSGVDALDTTTGATDDNLRAHSLDFTRHSTASVGAGADIDFTGDSRAKYFSLDGGTTNLTPGVNGGFSTGVNFGDGRQASHWKDNLGLGIMDPTALPAGQVNVVSDLDLQALDAIGWDLVPIPEPGTAAVGLALIGLGLIRRRRGVQDADDSLPHC